MAGTGNLEWLKRIDRVEIWTVPGLDPLTRIDIDLDNLAFKNGQGLPAIALSSDGRTVAFNDQLTSLAVRDVAGKNEDRRFAFENQWIQGIGFRSSDRELVVLLMDPIESGGDEPGLELATLNLDNGAVNRRPIGKRYRWLSSDHLGERMAFRAEHASEAIGMESISPTGETIAFFRVPAGELKGTVEVRNIESWSLLQVFEFPLGLGSLTFSDDDRYLAIISTASLDTHGTDSNSLRVVDVQENDILLDVDTVGHPNHSYSAAFSPDGSLLATGTRCDGVQVWDLERKRRIGFAQFGSCRSSAITTGLAFSRDGTDLYMLNEGGHLRVVQVEDIVASPADRPVR